MRNMKPYDLKDAFEVYKDAVDRKTDVQEMKELLSIEQQMYDCYNNYDNHFAKNDLEFMPNASVGVDHKNVLIGLYG